MRSLACNIETSELRKVEICLNPNARQCLLGDYFFENKGKLLILKALIFLKKWE